MGPYVDRTVIVERHFIFYFRFFMENKTLRYKKKEKKRKNDIKQQTNQPFIEEWALPNGDY